MRILITNVRLGRRGGAETYIYTLARGLQEKGHTVLAYTSDPSLRPRLLETDVIPVATDLDRLPFTPDVIHAHHHLDAMTALCGLPGVPALYQCHGAVWRESAPTHPRIYRYATVSRTLRERIATEFSIPPERITAVFNGVDLDRFRTVRDAPNRLSRALFFNQRHREGSDTVEAVRAASTQFGLTLDFAGWPFGPWIPDPQKILPTYDVVFASGLSAIEALASGCAVVIVGRTSCGPLVRPDNFDRLRDVNFSIAVNSSPPSAEAIVNELERYVADEARQVTARLRVEGDFRVTVDTLLGLYEEVIAEHRGATPDPIEEVRAIGRYLRGLVPLINATDRHLGGYWSWQGRAESFDALRDQVARLQQQIEKAP